MEVNELESVSIKKIPVEKEDDTGSFQALDAVAVEEPLEIRVLYGPDQARGSKNISVTMRTPGNDAELATGFLFTEGIISSPGQIKRIIQSDFTPNSVIVELDDTFTPALANADRNFYTTSSCGVCGKSSIDSIKTVSQFLSADREQFILKKNIFFELPFKLKNVQENFISTGGIHASGLFSPDGKLILLREDVGRHNALDKLIGAAIHEDHLPLEHAILLLSGRASFELIQKAAMAGIWVVAAIGAPSSLAVELAKECDITLIGFLKDKSFNIYHTAKNVIFDNIY